MAAGESGRVRRNGGALAVLGALLDRSVEEIGWYAADARRMDGHAVYRAADVWDNNTYPLVTAALARTRWGRERRARRALRWMADFGEARQTWIRGHAAAAGLRLDPRWLPPRREPGSDVDVHGRPRAPGGELIPEHVADLAAAYDLAGARVRVFRAERSGDRLDARVRLTLPRTYPVAAPAAAAVPAAVPAAAAPASAAAPTVPAVTAPTAPAEAAVPAAAESPAVLHLSFEGVTAARFDADDAGGVAFRHGPGGAVLRIGEHGEVRAAACSFRLDDTWWAQSPAGRRAAAAVPAGRPRTPRGVRDPYHGYLGRNAQAAVLVLHDGMVAARQVRNYPHAHRVPLAAFHRAFAGAGTDLVAAAAQPTPRRRDGAFGALVETWVRRGGPALDAFFTETLSGRLHRPDLLAAGRAARGADAPNRVPGPDIAPGEPLPPEAELRSAWYEAERAGDGFRREAFAVVHLAVPPAGGGDGGDGGWRLRGVRALGPVAFAVRAEAFAGPAQPQVGERDCVAGGGALRVAAPAGWERGPGPGPGPEPEPGPGPGGG